MQRESCRFAVWHVAHHGLVNPDAGFVGRDGGYVQYGARLEPLRLALTLVGFTRHTAYRTEHEIGIHLRSIVEIAQE